MTYATDKGLEIGKTYTLLECQNGVPSGTHVTFIEDDVTCVVKFAVPYDVDSDGWTYLTVSAIGDEVSSPSRLSPFTFAVAPNKTEVTINRALTTTEVIAVLKIIEGK